MWTASVASSLCIQRNEDIWLDFLLKPFFDKRFPCVALRRNELFQQGTDIFRYDNFVLKSSSFSKEKQNHTTWHTGIFQILCRIGRKILKGSLDLMILSPAVKIQITLGSEMFAQGGLFME